LEAAEMSAVTSEVTSVVKSAEEEEAGVAAATQAAG
jgi:hypothetical protein